MACCNGGTSRKRVCSDAQRYVQRVFAGAPKRAIVACEGVCIKGEVARTAANLLAYRLERHKAVRICFGDAVPPTRGCWPSWSALRR